MSLDKFIQENISAKYEYEQNPFPLLYIDMLSKCNMKCKICYNDNLESFTLQTDLYEDLLRKLPNKVFMRFVGGEPTIHPDFFKFIELTRNYKNFVTVSSNGIKYADEYFVKELSKPVYNNKACGYGITLNGGFYVDHVAWELIDNDKSISWVKIRGLDNLIDNNIKNIGLTAIIVRGVNEYVVNQLYRFSLLHKNITNLKFRSVGTNLTDFKTKTYSTREFVDNILLDIIKTPDKILCSGLNKDDSRCNECCYEIKKNNKSIKHIEFGTEGANKCWKRGYVDFKAGLIYPFFEYEVLKAKYYEIKSN